MREDSLYFEGIDPFVKLNYQTLRALADNKIINNDYGLYRNQIYIASDEYDSQSPLCIRVCPENTISKHKLKCNYGDVKASDLYQKIALDLMNNSRIPLVVCLGRSGTGKSHCALATALRMLESKSFDKVYFIKPMVGVSKSRYMGTLPGSESEKVRPFLNSFFDVAYSLGMTQELESYLESGIVEFVTIDFIRGRSLEDALVIGEEIQNLDKHDFVSVISRIGKNSRVFLMGDPSPLQNDIRTESGMVSFVSDERFWNSPYTASIHLQKRMRNPIVELAEDIVLPS